MLVGLIAAGESSIKIGGTSMKVLKIVLRIFAILCLAGFILAVLPWQMISNLFQWFIAESPTAEPVTMLMFRVASVLYGMIGIFFLLLARNPLIYGSMLLLAAYGLMAFGVICFIGGIGYGLPVCIYLSESIFCVAGGVLLFIFRKKAGQNPA